MASRQFSGHQDFYPSRSGGTLGGDRKAATALVFQDVVGGIASTVAVQGDDGSIIAIQASALNTDQIIINVAIVYVNALGGGEIYIEQSTYTTAATVTMLASVNLYGAGYDTHITGAGDFHLITVSSVDNITLTNFRLSGTSIGNNVDAIFVEDGSDDFRIDAVWITDSDRDGVHVEGTDINHGWVSDCYISEVDQDAISVNMDAANWVNYMHISGNTCITAGRRGISAIGLVSSEINGNITQGNGQEGIYIYRYWYGTIDGNVCYLNVYHGINLADGAELLVSGNICSYNDSGDTATYDGIYIGVGAIEGITITGNSCYTNHRYGIGTAAGVLYSTITITGNVIMGNDRHGIFIDYSNFTISGNMIYDNGSDTANTYDGINVGGNVSTGLIESNYICADMVDVIQRNGVRLTDGADHVSITGNYCYYHNGSGIVLVANNDDCYITENFLRLNGQGVAGYGIEILAATCNDNFVKDNYYSGNVTGAINDAGTDTRVHEVDVTAPNPDSYVGYHATQQMLDNVQTVIRFEAPVPEVFQELVTAHVIVIPGGTGNLSCIDVTEYGRICHDELYNAHDGSVDYTVGNVIPVTQNELECIDVTETLDSLTAYDWIGNMFIRVGDDGADTVNAKVDLLGYKLRYV